MHRVPRSALHVLLLGLTLWCSACAEWDPPRDSEAAPPRPNIVFIFTDDHATQALGCYGSTLPSVTPRLDALAREGAVFENCFCGNAICGPSRATVLTGLHSHANGFTQNGARFNVDLATFPKELQAAGYSTALFGKWHLDSVPQGFDCWEILPDQGEYYDPTFITAQGRERREGYVTDLITERALRWMREERDPSKPFLLCIWHKAPHREWLPAPRHFALLEDAVLQPPPTLFDNHIGRPGAAVQEMTIARHLMPDSDLKLPPGTQDGLAKPQAWATNHARARLSNMRAAFKEPWQAHYDPRNAAFAAHPPTGKELVVWKWREYIKDYLRCVKAVDEGVGAVLDTLEDEGLGSACVIYSSDQGFFLGEHGFYDKRWMYEEALRMPLIVRWPGQVAANWRVPELCQNTDFAPTLLDIAGVRSGMRAHGRSLLPFLRGQDTPPRRAIYYRYYEHPGTHNVARHMGVRTERFKLLFFEEDGHKELFDLAADPQELCNLALDPRQAALVKQLSELLRAEAAAVGDVMPTNFY
jgi:N-acetylglucosamine-6-sulfatase